jgi:hypothetical protein
VVETEISSFVNFVGPLLPPQFMAISPEAERQTTDGLKEKTKSIQY